MRRIFKRLIKRQWGRPLSVTALNRSLAGLGTIDESILRYVLDQSLDCIKILGPAGEIKYINNHGRCALEIDDVSAIEGKPGRSCGPKDRAKSSPGLSSRRSPDRATRSKRHGPIGEARTLVAHQHIASPK